MPAVRLARQLIEAGELGEIHHFRGRYLQDWGSDRRRPVALRRQAAGSGALGDLGAHVVDLARYLVGEIAWVAGSDRHLPRPAAVGRRRLRRRVSFADGALGTLEASRFARGRKNGFAWEINGSRGSLAFDLERLNELQVSEGSRAASARCW